MNEILKHYIYPTYEAGKNLAMKNIEGAIINLNLIRLKEVADYAQFPELAPTTAISGYDAFMKYVKLTQPFLEQSGSELLFIGKGDHFLIGPEAEKWDLCLLIKQKSVQDFFAFEQNDAYMQITGPRLAAVADARLLPLQSLTI